MINNPIINFLKKNYLWLSLFLAAFIIRLIGTKPGFSIYQPDEGMSYSSAIHMIINKFKPNSFDYPAGVPLLHTLIYQTLILPFVFLKLVFQPSELLEVLRVSCDFPEVFENIIFGHSGIKAMYWSRYISATIGALCIPLIYWTSKKLFNRRVGLFSAFFLAFNYRHVLGSHFGLPDVHNSFFSLLAFFASVLLLEKNTRKRYLLAGITCGLAFSMKYQPFSFLPFFLVHLIWARRKRSFRYLFHSHFFKALVLSFLTFLIINPYFFFNLNKAVKRFLETAMRYQAGVFQIRPYPYFYLYHWGIGRLPSMAILLGMIFILISRPQKFLILFSFIFAFFFVFTYYSGGGGYPRNFVSIMPLLMIFAGYFMELIYLFLQKIRLTKINFLQKTVHCSLFTVILIFSNFTNIKNSSLLSYYYAQPWNSSQLDQWFKEKMPEKVKIRAYPLFIHYTLWEEKHIEMLDWSYSQGPHSLAEFQEEKTDFAILNTHTFEEITYWWRLWPSKVLFQYDQVPFDYINSDFYGLSLQELLNHTVHEIYKPWQAASEYNFLIFKIPQKPEKIGKRIAYFGFDEKNQLWPIRSTFGFKPITADWESQVGKVRPGSLVIKGSGESTSRLASPPIKIQSGKLYTVKGWIKNSPSQEREPDGFLRIDFYRGKTESELDKPGLRVAISARASVSGEWFQKQTSLIAPQEAHYLTVSFQRKDPNDNFVSYLDDVEIFETDILPEEKFKELPYIKPTIPSESIYYNSFL